jgi:hypothetical protein
MVHLVFDRPTENLKVFATDKTLWNVFEASGDAWGDGMSAPYGFDYPIPPGHYLLTSAQSISPALASEGNMQIPVIDMDLQTIAALVNAGDAQVSSTQLNFGGVVLPTGGLQLCKRSGIMIHGGGSNLLTLNPPQDPFDPDQQLCKTYGCTRMHNKNLDDLATYLTPLFNGNHVVYSAVGDPKPLPF